MSMFRNKYLTFTLVTLTLIASIAEASSHMRSNARGTRAWEVRCIRNGIGCRLRTAWPRPVRRLLGVTQRQAMRRTGQSHYPGYGPAGFGSAGSHSYGSAGSYGFAPQTDPMPVEEAAVPEKDCPNCPRTKAAP